MAGLDNPIHLIFLLVLVLIVFGAKRLPEMGRSLGGGVRGFKEALSTDVAHQGALEREVGAADRRASGAPSAHVASASEVSPP